MGWKPTPSWVKSSPQQPFRQANVHLGNDTAQPSTQRALNIGDTNHADLSDYCSSGNQAQGRSQEGIFLELCRCTPKMPIHVCTHVPCFLNATEATQFGRSWHFQVCLSAPSFSCLFLPTIFCLALVVRFSYPYFQCFQFASLVVISKFAPSWSFRKMACSSLLLVTRNSR